MKVHRLVAIAFLDNPLNYPMVNHKDGIKTNNKLENLEWCTREHNMKEAYRLGLKNSSGKNNGNSKLSDEQILKIRELYDKGMSIVEISKKFNIHRSYSYFLCKRLKRLDVEEKTIKE